MLTLLYIVFFYDWWFRVNVDTVRIEEKDILVVRSKYCHCSYS